MRFTVLLLLAHACVTAQTLDERVSKLLDTASGRNGFWGVHAVNLSTGVTLIERQADTAFVPASTAKLFSSALALERLGPPHRFVTLVTSGRAPDAGGRLAGDLVLRGAGDPTISSRPLPFGRGRAGADPLLGIQELADQLVANGVRKIDGDIIGDDTAYAWEPYPEGRAGEDSLWDYGAPVSALSINENRVVLTIRPSRRAGDPAVIRFSPPLEYFVVENRVRTTPGGTAHVSVERLGGSRQIRIWGTLPLKAGATSRLLAIEDPAEYAAAALHDALVRRGVAIAGKPVARHRFVNEVEDLAAGRADSAASPGVELARRTSAPLEQVLAATVKASLNLHAELMLREVGRARRGAGTRQAGLAELGAFLREAGVEPEECVLVDGSGLSMYDLVTPRALTSLLSYMDESPLRETWRGLLAEPGEDGTFQRRLTDAPPGSVQVKTGSMSRVHALAGYAESRNGETIVFAILVNNFTAPAAGIRATIDKIVMLLVQEGSQDANLRIPL